MKFGTMTVDRQFDHRFLWKIWIVKTVFLECK